jgi:hypothetical protein
MNRLQLSFPLIFDLVVSVIVVVYVLAFLSLLWLGSAPLGLTFPFEAWLFFAFVLAALMLILPLSRNVRIFLTLVSGILLASMGWLYFRAGSLLESEDPFTLLPVAVMMFAASGLAPRLRARSGRGRRT